MIISLRWVKDSDKWHFYRGHRFLMDFPNCKNFHFFFRSLDEEDNNYYDIKPFDRIEEKTPCPDLLKKPSSLDLTASYQPAWSIIAVVLLNLGAAVFLIGMGLKV